MRIRPYQPLLDSISNAHFWFFWTALNADFIRVIRIGQLSKIGPFLVVQKCQYPPPCFWTLFLSWTIPVTITLQDNFYSFDWALKRK